MSVISFFFFFLIHSLLASGNRICGESRDGLDELVKKIKRNTFEKSITGSKKERQLDDQLTNKEAKVPIHGFTASHQRILESDFVKMEKVNQGVRNPTGRTKGLQVNT